MLRDIAIALPTGGETRFWDSSDKKSPTTTVVPEAGMCLVFNHDWLHGGLALHAGLHHNLKYIIRTDVMFVRQVSSSHAPAPRMTAARQ